MHINLPTLTLAVQSFTNGRFTMDERKYVSRLPYVGDLNSIALENIYSGIKSNFGETSASNFVRLINSLEDLSASAFRLALCEFWESGCSATKVIKYSLTDIEILGNNEPTSIIDSQFDLMKLWSQSEKKLVKRMSMSIKKPFMLAHIGEIPTNEQDHI